MLLRKNSAAFQPSQKASNARLASLAVCTVAVVAVIRLCLVQTAAVKGATREKPRHDVVSVPRLDLAAVDASQTCKCVNWSACRPRSH